MRTFRSCVTGAGPSTSAINYTWIVGTNAQTWVATESQRDIPVSGPFRARRLYVELDVAPGAGNYWDYIVRRNGQDTVLKVRISGTNVSNFEDAAMAYFNDTDTISFEARPSTIDNGALIPAAAARVRWRVEFESSGSFPLLGGTNASHTGAATNTVAFLVIDGSGSWEALSGVGDPDVAAQIVCPIGGKLRRLRVKSSGSPGAGKAYDVAVYLNGAATGLTAHLADLNTAAIDFQHYVTVAAGDRLSIGVTPSGTPTAVPIRFMLDFVPTTDGQSFVGFGHGVAPSNTVATYEQTLGRGAANWGNLASEPARQAPGPAGYTITGMYGKVGTAPGAAASGKKWTLTLRKGAVDTLAAFDILETATTNSVTGLAIALADNDLLSIKAAPTATPAADTGGVHLGVALSGPTTTQTSALAVQSR